MAFIPRGSVIPFEARLRRCRIWPKSKAAPVIWHAGRVGVTTYTGFDAAFGQLPVATQTVGWRHSRVSARLFILAVMMRKGADPQYRLDRASDVDCCDRPITLTSLPALGSA